MLNMNERMNKSLFNLNYKIISIVRLFNFTRSAILPHNLPKLYSTGRFSWSTICYCAGGRGLKVLNGTRPVEYTQCCEGGSRTSGVARGGGGGGMGAMAPPKLLVVNFPINLRCYVLLGCRVIKCNIGNKYW